MTKTKKVARPEGWQQKQNLFARTYWHILDQGKPSLSPDGEECRYRQGSGNNKLMCAAGPFIKQYTSKMENNSWSELCDSFESRLDPVAVQHKSLVQWMQEAHDGSSRSYHEANAALFLNDFKEAMQNVAEHFDLSFPPRRPKGTRAPT